MSGRLSDEVTDYSTEEVGTVYDLVVRLSRSGGFQAREIGRGLEVFVKMVGDKDCTRFLSFTANMVSTGLRGVLAEVIRDKMVDVVVTTGGTADHDIARAQGGRYYYDQFFADDAELRKKEIHRLGNVMIPLKSYGPPIESFVGKIVAELGDNPFLSPSEILAIAGKHITDRHSILKAAYEAKVPIVSPGLVDSAFGTALWYSYQRGKFKLDVLKDMTLMSDKVFERKRTGAIILGGGISKHHTIWWNQFKEGLEYVLAVTTGTEFDGSLTGARISEAITWGKVKPDALQATIMGDATVVFPLILTAYRQSHRNAK
jgi:deoxyhypusine synthase